MSQIILKNNATCQCGQRFNWPDKLTCPKCGSDSEGQQEMGWRHINKYRGPRVVDGKKIEFSNRMEYNMFLYYRWLQQIGKILRFEYQPKPPFDFTSKYKHGTTRYTPDFKITDMSGEYYIETKGRFTKKDKTKFNRMRELYPQVRLELVTYKDYKRIERDVAGLIEGWESR